MIVAAVSVSQRFIPKAKIMQSHRFAAVNDNLFGSPPPNYSIAWWACGQHTHDAARPALIERLADGGERHLTFAEIWSRSGRIARWLDHQGIRKGDRVAIAGPQCVEAAIAHIAVYRAGAVALPLSMLFGPDALAHRLADACPTAVIFDGTIGEALAEAMHAVQRWPRLLVWGGASLLNAQSIEDVSLHGSDDFLGPQMQPDDPCLVIYTSGTTGQPKGALQPQRAIWGHLPAIMLAQNVDLSMPSRFWTPADWSWLGGLVDGLLSAWHLGLPVVLNPAGRFDPARAWRILVDHNITNAFIPPTALRMMSHVPQPQKRLDLRGLMTGGEALGGEFYSTLRKQFGCPVNEVFGQTEMSCIVGNAEQEYPVRPGSAGKPYPGATIAILGERGSLPAGEVGEIAVRRDAPTMFLGYWNRPADTTAKFRDDWALTGDLGMMDDEGYVFVIGRKDDIIITSGYRVSPTDVEACIVQHPDVALAAVVGTPDPLRGQILTAIVQPRAGVKAGDALVNEIQQLVRRRLAKFEYPRRIEFVTALPLTETGKIRRAALRAAYSSHHPGEAP